jgi:hypothetical protein
MFVENCIACYSPTENITIDETVLPFRGRCAFRVYFGSSKPQSYGLKAYTMVDSTTFYVVNMEIYLGRQAGLNPLDNSPTAVVTRLIQPITGTGRNITTDNWYTNVQLAISLQKDHRLTLVGTVRKNRREVPKYFTVTRDRPLFSSLFGFTKDFTLVSYKVKRNKVVLALSSMHHDTAINPDTGDKLKPEIITFYNSTKGGVDTMDQMCATYSVLRRTRRWPQCVFYSLLNMAGINSMVIYKMNRQFEKEPRRIYLMNLGRGLVNDHLRRRACDAHFPKLLRQAAARFSGTPPPLQQNLQQTAGYRRRCDLCPRNRDRKSPTVCAICNKSICKDHSVVVCPDCV